ncbi:hypothetical protein MNEG_16670, partial [Monoraphidium neglectum]
MAFHYTDCWRPLNEAFKRATGDDFNALLREARKAGTVKAVPCITDGCPGHILSAD